MGCCDSNETLIFMSKFSMEAFLEINYVLVLGFCDSNETLIFMPKFSMEAFLEINYVLVFQRKEGHIFSNHVPKRPKALKKIDFLYFNVQV